MKNLSLAFRKLFVMSLCAGTYAAVSSAQSVEFTFEGLNYEIEDGVVSVGYNTDYEGDLVIPSYVTYEDEQYPVTAIGDYAFNYDSTLTSVVFPETLKKIGNNAFADCSGLQSVEIPSGVTTLGEYAFAWTGLTSVVIPENVTEAGMNTFCYCYSLQSAQIPGSLTVIPYGMFSGCPLETLTIGEGVEVIGEYSFADCTTLTEFSLPSTVKRIESQAFTRCNFHDVTVPGSVEYIGYYGIGQIGEYQELGKLTIADSDTPLELGDGAFAGSYFTEYYQGRDLSHAIDFDTMYLRSLTTGGGCKRIDGFSITYDQFQTVELHEGLEVIGEDFLSINYGLLNLEIPSTVNMIEKGALSILQELDNLVFRDSEVPLELGEYVMGICDPVNMYWGREFANPEERLFFGGSRMETLTIGGGCKTVNNSFSSKTSLREVVLKEGVERIETEGLSNNGALEKVELPSTLKYIGEKAFSYDPALVDCVIPSSVEYIGDSAFGSTLIGDQDLSNVTYLGGWAFSYCKNITNVILPANIELINWCAFLGTGLTELTVPAGVSYIDTSAFGECENLKKITIEDGTAPIYLSQMGVFIGSPVEDLHVGRLIHGSHFTKTDLKNLSIGGGCTRVMAYGPAPVLENVVLGPEVLEIDEKAFEECPAIVTVSAEALVPPTMAEDAFDQVVYDTARLAVPDESVEAYASAIGWEKFLEIHGASGVDNVAESAAKSYRVFTLEGVRVYESATLEQLETLQPGIYVINGRKVKK